MSTTHPAAWRLAIPGLAATFIGLGLGRFSFTPMIPLLVAEGTATSPEAARAAAALLVGYTIGAISASTLGRRFGAISVLRAAVWGIAVALLVEALPIGIMGHGLVRGVTGCLGGLLIVLGPTTVMRAALPEQRPVAAGIIYSGVGLGILVSGAVVPLLAPWGTASVAAALGLLAAVVATLFGWRWPVTAEPPVPADDHTAVRWPRPLVFLGLAYGLDAIGYVPHTAYWSDFIASELGQGVSAGGHYWMLFGIGALSGPILAGWSAKRIGFRRSLIGAFSLKAVFVSLPVFSVAPVALVVSSIGVGALVPGVVTLVSGRLTDFSAPHRLAGRWGLMTAVFAVSQMVAGWVHAEAFALLGSYRPLFMVASLVLVASALLAGRGETPVPQTQKVTS